jgi:hypothetical protein
MEKILVDTAAREILYFQRGRDLRAAIALLSRLLFDDK